MNTTPHAIEGFDVLEQARVLAHRRESFALATVVWRQGPSSGQQGSRAIITADGRMYGWIGGACAEPAVVREAQRVIAAREPGLLLLGTSDQFAGAVPEGMTVIPISCQSDGALEVYVEPVVPAPHLVVVGRSPMVHTLVDLAHALDWRTDLRDAGEFAASDVAPDSAVVIATQGHGDEDALEVALSGRPAFVGLVASPARREAVLGYLADRGVRRDLLDRVHAPVGLDLGRTSHREIAVAILAELVQLRAAGALDPRSDDVPAPAPAATALDPVCGMTVTADASSHPLEHGGTTYHFCHVGCRTTFAQDPDAYLPGDRATTPAERSTGRP